MILKCKICGGALDVAASDHIATCRYCGNAQTLPQLQNDRHTAIFVRANDLRRQTEFDKAIALYEQLLIEDNTDADIYWSLVLCRYGVDYVKSPSTGTYLPTVNRAQFTSIFDDGNYKSALMYANDEQRLLYEKEAAAINNIQKQILDISQKETPFDVFICYKETDGHGNRTLDSVLANDLYHQLTEKGFKVFFSRITLEDKLGVAYEPYIFAALNSAKVMVVLGTHPDHFRAVWVKNEWSRYLLMIKNGADKTLIPAYKDMHAYDLPEEFSHLQAQDMSKLGFMQDLLRGIEKLVKPTAAAKPTADVDPLLKRTFLFLEDGVFDRANELCEQVLNRDPENGQAYLAKLMIETKTKTMTELAQLNKPLDSNRYYQKILRFGDRELVAFVQTANQAILDRKNNRKREKTSDKKKKWLALLLCLIPYTGWFGIHCFYLSRPKLAFLKMFTVNFLLVGWILDIITIANGTFKIGKGKTF